MRNRILWALAGLNVLLVMTLAGRLTSSTENTAHAQAKRPSDYIMVPGEVGGGTSAVVYMIDTSNGMLGAMTFDASQQQLHTMPPIDLARVFDTGAPGAPRGPAVAPGTRAPGR